MINKLQIISGQGLAASHLELGLKAIKTNCHSPLLLLRELLSFLHFIKKYHYFQEKDQKIRYHFGLFLLLL